MAHWSAGSGSIHPRLTSSRRAALTRRSSTSKARATQEALTLPRPSNPAFRARGSGARPRVRWRPGRVGRPARNRSKRRGTTTTPLPRPMVSSRPRRCPPGGSGNPRADPDQARSPAAWSLRTAALRSARRLRRAWPSRGARRRVPGRRRYWPAWRPSRVRRGRARKSPARQDRQASINVAAGTRTNPPAIFGAADHPPPPSSRGRRGRVGARSAPGIAPRSAAFLRRRVSRWSLDRVGGDA